MLSCSLRLNQFYFVVAILSLDSVNGNFLGFDACLCVSLTQLGKMVVEVDSDEELGVNGTQQNNKILSIILL